jgi:hypothetical protein
LAWPWKRAPTFSQMGESALFVYAHRRLIVKIKLLLWLILVSLWLVAPVLAAQPLAEPSINDLYTAAGVAALTALFLGVLVKPWLRAALEKNNEEPAEEHRLYKPIMNSAAYGVATALALLGAFGLGLTYESIVSGILIAIVGAAAAIGGYETARGK